MLCRARRHLSEPLATKSQSVHRTPHSRTVVYGLSTDFERRQRQPRPPSGRRPADNLLGLQVAV